jgi:hypothetical protein
MHTIKQFAASRASLTLLSSSVIWFVGALALIAHSDSKDGWSTTPLPWMVVLAVTPVLCFVSGVAFLWSQHRSRLTWLHWIALVAGAITIVAGGLLMIAVLGSLRGMGIV